MNRAKSYRADFPFTLRRFRPFRDGISEGCARGEAIGATGLTSIRDAPWPRRQGDTIRGEQEIRGSTAHSGSHVSTGNPLPDPQIAWSGLRDRSERPFRGNHAVLDWGTTPPRPVGICVAIDSISVPVIRPSCSPVSHYGIRPAVRSHNLWTCDLCQLRDARASPSLYRARLRRWSWTEATPCSNEIGAIRFP